MRYIAFVLALFVPASAYAQGCYGGQYSAPVLQSAPCVSRQVINVPVTVETETRVIESPPQVFAAPQSSYVVPQGFSSSACGVQGFSLPVLSSGFSLGYGGGYGLNTGFGLNSGFNAGYGLNTGFGLGGVRSFNSGLGLGLGGGVRSFNSGFGLGGGGGAVELNAISRNGRIGIDAVGARRIHIERGLLGRINGVSVDSRRRLFPF